MNTIQTWARHALSYLRKHSKGFLAFGKRIGWWKVSLGGGIMLGILFTLSLMGGSTAPAEVVQSSRAVTLKTVGELSQSESALPVVGIVKSQSEAIVRSESSGQVTGLYKELGDQVRAGEIIAEMENSREKAAVLQAEGSFEAAQAQASKVSGGARTEQRSILEANVASARSSLAAARTSAVNTILSAYASVDDSIRRKADPLFSNPESSAPQFNPTITDSQLATDLQSARITLTSTLVRESSAASTLSSQDDLNAELTKTEGEVRAAKNFIDKVNSALNKTVPNASFSASTIAGYQADASAARVALTNALAAISAARDTLAARDSALTVATQSLEQGVTGGQAEDVAAASAAVKQALGALAAARANLEKTIIRAPISGVINQLSFERGDFLSSFTQVVTIANNGALEIVASVTDRDSREIQVGGRARIAGKYDGVITRIAPALDPVTKKVEVRIGLPKDAQLLNGEAVTVELARTQTENAPEHLVIPLSALKIGTDATVVFSVAEDQTLIPHEVTLGELLGDEVVIEGGIDASLPIVLDARGLKSGQKVEVKH